MGELNSERLETRYRDWPPRSWYATRRSRRTLVGAGACSAGLIWVSAIVCLYLAPSDLAMWTTFALMGAALVIYVMVYSALVGATRGMVGLAERYLDERQSRERQRIQVEARRGTTAVLIALGALLSLAMPRGEMFVQVPAAAVIMLMLGVIATHVILPALVAGWRMSDPPPDDEDEDGRQGEATGRTGNGQPIDPNTAT
ncbi:hypothetical protein [Streptosporangium sp. NBC_01756]|uniref:hypothetical protein n=1 Tax=Streptosporangium sp. NBC_01756 TaxID=2975950 RepID=UPI002DDC6B8D|nr:hypothetical protein [Streptosporangium sp. NBC_01756]WSC88085.1 hypothetical protein OIE48_07750 [Streptosporangium sp. NBC_01756]